MQLVPGVVPVDTRCCYKGVLEQRKNIRSLSKCVVGKQTCIQVNNVLKVNSIKEFIKTSGDSSECINFVE